MGIGAFSKIAMPTKWKVKDCFKPGDYLKISRATFLEKVLNAGVGTKMDGIYDELVADTNLRGIQFTVPLGICETYGFQWVHDILDELKLRNKYAKILLGEWREFNSSLTPNPMAYILPSALRTSHGSYQTCTPGSQCDTVQNNGSGKLRVNTLAAHGLTTADNNKYIYVSAWSGSGGTVGPYKFTYVDADTYDLTGVTYTDATHPGKPTTTSSTLAHTLWDYAYANRSGNDISTYNIKLWDATIYGALLDFYADFAAEFDKRPELIRLVTVESPPGNQILASEYTDDATYWAARTSLMRDVQPLFPNTKWAQDTNSRVYAADWYPIMMAEGFASKCSNMGWVPNALNTTSNPKGDLRYYADILADGREILDVDEQGDDILEYDEPATPGVRPTPTKLNKRLGAGDTASDASCYGLFVHECVLQRDTTPNTWLTDSVYPEGRRVWHINKLIPNSNAGRNIVRPTNYY